MKRLKYLFTVPKDEKVSEKHMMRVLISTVCSVLLCMSCLVSTTWAWFSVSITSEGNVVQIDQWEDPKETTAETTETQSVNVLQSGEETTEATTDETEATTEATEETTEITESTEVTKAETEETTETTETTEASTEPVESE